jgi:ArsR family transcriptional regulator
MGTTKSEFFTDDQNRFASIAKSLGHPARIAIIEYLLTANTCVCGDIVNELPLAQATISQHLKDLRESGLIKGEIEGKNTCYCINPDTFDEFKIIFEGLIGKVQNQQSCC